MYKANKGVVVVVVNCCCWSPYNGAVICLRVYFNDS